MIIMRLQAVNDCLKRLEGEKGLDNLNVFKWVESVASRPIHVGR